MTGLCDAHLHLHDPALQAGLTAGAVAVPVPQIDFQLTNGTHPDDWARVATVQGFGGAQILRAYGVHPWRVLDLPTDWLQQLRGRLASGAASVGEIGLDNWIEPRDPELQRQVFMQQLELAADLQLPPSIHCLRAWGALVDCLHAAPSLSRGFLVHAFAGSVDVLNQLADLGGYFSFSAYGADPARKRIRDAIRACPADRLLLETDAPDMAPPADACQWPLAEAAGARLHHPAEIATACAFVAEVRGESPEAIAELTTCNFRWLFRPGLCGGA